MHKQAHNQIFICTHVYDHMSPFMQYPNTTVHVHLIHICVYTHAPTYVIPSYVHTCSHVHVHMYTDPFVIHKYSCSTCMWAAT